MTALKVLAERAFAALFTFLFITSCSTTCHQWEYSKVDTWCHCYDISKACLTPECDLRGLELEIAKTPNEGMTLYINVFTLNVERDSERPDKVLVTLSSNGETLSFYADVLQGGQRLIVPKEAADIIITTLLSEIPFTIHFGRYSSEITPKGFSKAYYSL